jgi:hypothetical protein
MAAAPPVPPSGRIPTNPRVHDLMSDQDKTDIRLEFARLKQEHADFDAAIEAMIAMGCDPIQIQRMKKKKLSMKDKLAQLEDRIVPDIIA